MSSRGGLEGVKKRPRFSKSEKKKQKKKAKEALNRWANSVNGAFLVELSFDLLSAINHRISDDQEALKEKLGPLGAEFDVLTHSLTNALLFKDPFLHADDFLEVMRTLLVEETSVCTQTYFNAWLAAKAHANGRTGLDRWKKHYSAQKSMLLAARRQYVLMPTPAVLFGCLSTVCFTEPLLHKDLRSIAIGQAGNPESDPVYLDRVPFGAHKISYDKRCQAFTRISDGVFFNITEIATNPQNPHLVTVEQTTESEGLTDMPNGVYETNPWIEILRSSQILYDAILDFADEWAKIDRIDVVYDWPEIESFKDGGDESFKKRTVYEVISIVRVCISKIVAIEKTRGDSEYLLADWPSEVVEHLFSFPNIFRRLIDSFLINVKFSDLHFFFAYFRGEFWLSGNFTF